MTDYKQGYNDGYAEGMRDAGLELQTLHDTYYAILSRGEAPERVMSDE